MTVRSKFPKKNGNNDHDTALETVFALSLSFIFIIITFGFLVLYSSSCTINLQTVHTTAQAKDVIDDNMTNDPNLNLKVPVI